MIKPDDLLPEGIDYAVSMMMVDPDYTSDRALIAAKESFKATGDDFDQPIHVPIHDQRARYNLHVL